MRHTVWYHDRQIGESDFELINAGRKRAGVFHPTAFGLTVLPAITAMVPAIFDFKDLCDREGIDTADEGEESADVALAAFGGTPEGERVLAAVRHVADLEVRDGRGRTLPWDSILISDMEQMRALIERVTGGERLPPREGVELPLLRYLISLTLARSRHTAPVRSATLS